MVFSYLRFTAFLAALATTLFVARYPFLFAILFPFTQLTTHCCFHWGLCTIGHTVFLVK